MFASTNYCISAINKPVIVPKDKYLVLYDVIACIIIEHWVSVAAVVRKDRTTGTFVVG